LSGECVQMRRRGEARGNLRGRCSQMRRKGDAMMRKLLRLRAKICSMEVAPIALALALELVLVFVLSVPAAAESDQIKDLIARFTADDPEVSSSAAKELEALGDQAIAYLVGVAKDTAASDSTRLRAIRSLRRIGANAVPGLMELVCTPEASVRRAAVVALGELGPSAAAAVPVLTDALTDDAPEVREAAASSLGRMGEAARPALPYLAIAKGDHDWRVAWAATQAIRRIDPQYDVAESIPELLKVVEDERGPLYRRFAVLRLLEDLSNGAGPSETLTTAQLPKTALMPKAADTPKIGDSLSVDGRAIDEAVGQAIAKATATWASPFQRRKFAVIQQGITHFQARFDDQLNLVRKADFSGHEIRESAWLAVLYFQSGLNIGRANALVRAVLETQAVSGYRYGNFKWNYEDSGIEDQNAVTFILPSLIYIFQNHSDQLEEELRADVAAALERGHKAVLELEKHIPVWYANVYLQMIACLVGLGDEEKALEWTRIFYDFTREYGINEYAAWGYIGVQLAGLQSAYERARNPELRRMLAELLELHWFDLVHQMHIPTLMLSPTSSRAKGSSGLKVLDAVRTLYYLYFGIGGVSEIDQPRVELLLTDYQPPEAVARFVEAKQSMESLEYQAKYGRVDAHIYQTTEFSLATQSGRRSAMGVLDTSKTLLSSEEHETSVQICVQNDGAYKGIVFKVSDVKANFDRHSVTSVQSGAQAIISYNFDPKWSIAESIYSYAILGLTGSIDELQINGVPWDFRPTALAASDSLAYRIGDTYVGIRFLTTDVIKILNHPVISAEKPILLARDGDEVVLRSYLAYDPSGIAFSQENRRLGYVIRLATPDEYPSLTAYSSAMSGIQIEQLLAGSVHSVAALIGDVELYLQEDLASNTVLAREMNGSESHRQYLLRSPYVCYEAGQDLALRRLDPAGRLPAVVHDAEELR